MTAGSRPGLPPDGGREWMLAVAQSDDREAFRLLVVTLRPALTRIAHRLIAPPYVEDLVQETWLRAWKYRTGYRGDAKPVAWLHTIMAKVAAGDEALRATPRPSNEIDTDDLEVISSPGGIGALLAAELIETVLGKLPPRDEALIRMRYADQASWATICAVLGFETPYQARKALDAVMRKLRARTEVVSTTTT